MSSSLRIDLQEPIAGALVIGDTGLGVAGSEVPAQGTHGPGFAFGSVALQPGFGSKEYRAELGPLPLGLVLRAYENSAFVAQAPDGSYVVPWTLYEDGAVVGSTTFTLTFGATSGRT
jgi:hypothetical protein